VTIIEAIRQILLANPQARILACAPSNSAADIIAERLLILGKSQLFRLNAPSRSASHLPVILRDVSRQNSSGTFEVPPVDELAKFRVIVSTCVSASVPSGIGIKPGHFSHVFIDEAGQACEPEALIAIKTLGDEKLNVILSGDMKQLGPVIRSNVALAFDFGASLLDRLTAMPLYNEKDKSGVTYAPTLTAGIDLNIIFAGSLNLYRTSVRILPFLGSQTKDFIMGSYKVRQTLPLFIPWNVQNALRMGSLSFSIQSLERTCGRLDHPPSSMWRKLPW